MTYHLDDAPFTIPQDLSNPVDDIFDSLINLPTGYWLSTFSYLDPMAATTAMGSNSILLSPDSPFSTTSEYTAVESPSSPAHPGTGTSSDTTKPQTYVVPSTPYTGLGAHASLSPPGAYTTYGQPRPQHLPGAAAAAAAVPGDTRMHADPLPLMTQAPDACNTSEVPPTAPPSSVGKVKQPAKRRRKQDTTKRFKCSYCGISMSAI